MNTITDLLTIFGLGILTLAILFAILWLHSKGLVKPSYKDHHDETQYMPGGLYHRDD